MLDWFDRVGYNADIAVLEKKYGLKLTKLDEWARTVVRRERRRAAWAIRTFRGSNESESRSRGVKPRLYMFLHEG